MRATRVAILLLAVNGCVLREHRAKYAIDADDGVIASNLPAVLSQARPTVRDGSLEIRYGFLLRNQSPSPLTLTPEDISAESNDAQVTTVCRQIPAGVAEGALPLTLAVNAHVRVDCLLRFPAPFAQLAATRDREIRLRVLVREPTREATAFTFKYLLRGEDLP